MLHCVFNSLITQGLMSVIKDIFFAHLSCFHLGPSYILSCLVMDFGYFIPLLHSFDMHVPCTF